MPPPPSFTPPPPPPSFTPPTLPPNLPGVPTNPAAPTGDDSVRLTFSNSPIGDVLNYYGVLTGKRVLTDNTVNATSTLNFDIAKSVPRAEAVRIIETVLTLNGYTVAPGEANIVKVLGPGKNARSVGIPIYSDPGELPRNDQVVSYLLRLRYLDPLETAGVLQQYIPPGNSVNFVALEKAGAVIVTDDATTVRRLVDLVASLDQPFAPVTEKWIRLERADATKAIEFLNSVFDSKNGSSSGSTPGQPGGAATSQPNTRRPIRRGDEAIREIEFFVQTQQLIFGGKRLGLRGSRTLPMLRALRRDGWIGAHAAANLTRAYDFLRRVEHRLQMMADQQTHLLPREPDALERFARFLRLCLGGAFCLGPHAASSRCRASLRAPLRKRAERASPCTPTP